MATASGRRQAASAVSAPPEAQAAPPPNSRDTAAEVRKSAQDYAGEALDALADLMRNAASESVRVSAANALLDRAHGRPAAATKAAAAADGGTASEAVNYTFRWLDPSTS